MKFVVAAILVVTCAAQGSSSDIWTYKFDVGGDACSDSAFEGAKDCLPQDSGALTYDIVKNCLTDYPGHSCLSHLDITAEHGAKFGLLEDTCTADVQQVQEFETNGFFIAFGPEYKSIESSGNLTVGFQEAPKDGCKFKLQFFAQDIADCKNPTEGNNPVVSEAEVAKDGVLTIDEIFKKGASSYGLVTTTGTWADCGTEVTNITCPNGFKISIEFEVAVTPSTTDASSVTIAAAAILSVAAALAAL